MQTCFCRLRCGTMQELLLNAAVLVSHWPATDHVQYSPCLREAMLVLIPLPWLSLRRLKAVCLFVCLFACLFVCLCLCCRVFSFVNRVCVECCVCLFCVALLSFLMSLIFVVFLVLFYFFSPVGMWFAIFGYVAARLFSFVLLFPILFCSVLLCSVQLSCVCTNCRLKSA